MKLLAHSKINTRNYKYETPLSYNITKAVCKSQNTTLTTASTSTSTLNEISNKQGLTVLCCVVGTYVCDKLEQDEDCADDIEHWVIANFLSQQLNLIHF
jgi:hypothetical protein